MSDPHQDSPSDRQLSRLYRQHATDEPSSAVDRQILTAARAALADRRSHARHGNWWQRWRMPLAFATTLLLTVALLLPRQPGELPAEHGFRQEFKRGDAPGAAPPAPAKSVAAPMPVKPAAVVAPSTMAVETLGKAASPAVAGSQGDRRASAEKAAGHDSTATTEAVPAATSPVATPAGAAASGPVRFESATVPAMPPAPARARSDAVSPAVWLERIRELRRDGKIEDAERQLQEFRRLNPAYPLPEEFRQ